MNSYHSSKLINLKLAEPKVLHKYLEERKKNFKYSSCEKDIVNYIQEYRGHLILRTWFIRIRKNEMLEYSECSRRTEDLIPVMSNCELNYIAGWIADYGHKWRPDQAYEGWNKNIGWLGGKILNYEEAIEKYDPHRSYEKGDHVNCSFFEYLIKLRQEPGVEMLVKNGYGSLINCLDMMDRTARSIDKILKVDAKWLEYLKGKSRPYLIACRRYKTEEEVCAYVLLTIRKDGILKHVKDHMAKFARYARQPGYESITYADYLKMAEEAGYPLNENRWLFPEELKEAHDRVMKELKKAKAKRFKKAFEEQLKKLSKYEYQEGAYLIRPAKDNGELIEESEALSHCVRTYAERHAKGLTAIFFIRKVKKPEEPYVTLELKGKQVIQVRAKYNARPDKKTRDFITKWTQEKKLKYEG